MNENILDENEFKNIVAENIAKFRKRAGLTQLELAEKLNYSDKSISKWERGEALPDVFVLNKLAALFGVSVDSFLNNERKEVKIAKKSSLSTRKKVIITALSVLICFFVATIAYGVFVMVNVEVIKPWLLFIAALPSSSIVLIVFAAIWARRIFIDIAISLLNWSMALLVFLAADIKNGYLFFIISAVFQILIVFWHFLKRN